MFRVFRHYVSTSALSLLAVETAVIFCIFLGFVGLAHGGGEEEQVLNIAPLVAASTGVVLLIMYSLGVYDRNNLANFRAVSNRLLVGLVIFAAVALAVFALERQYYEVLFGQSHVLFGFALVGVFSGIFVTRIAFGSIGRLRPFERRILVLGAGKMAARIETLGQNDRSGLMNIVGFLPAGSEQVEVARGAVVALEGSIAETARRVGADELVVAVSDRRGMPTRPLLDCRMQGIPVTSYLTFWERETRQVDLDALDPSWLIYSDGFRLSDTVNTVLKRWLDVVISLSFLVFMLPVLAGVALAIRVDSRGPVFYRQERVGRNGQNFHVLKFRTMVVDAEREGVPQWASLRDPRITRIGNFLRLSRLDEVPQVINVLRGDMSFIGPRPERPFFVESLNESIPYYNERHRVRPGITGWAQINYPYGASLEDAKAKLSYDLYYIKNYSIMIDLLVLFSTVQVVLFSKGAR